MKSLYLFLTGAAAPARLPADLLQPRLRPAWPTLWGENMEPAKLLIIDSDREVAGQLRDQLERAGFETVHTSSGREGLQRFLELMPQAIILRDALPGLDGWDTARRIREMSNVPIVFISDHRDMFAMERALHIGDDYVAPPWNWERLAVKLGALLRRRREEQDHTLLYDDGCLKVDFARRLVARDGRPVHLTDTEFKLLSCFLRRPNRVLTYDELLTQVWGHTHFGAKSHVSLYVRYLRKKLEADPANPEYFNTEWGVGYSFRPRVPAMRG
jgi:two-component system KDP operon response regulator KdpE